MRLSAAIVVLAAGAIARAQLSNIPQCSLTCFTTALSGDGCSELTDFACHCQQPSLVGDIVPCVNKACGVADRQAVSSVVDNLCSGVGHPISIPPMDTSVPSTTAVGGIVTTTKSSNATTVSGIEPSYHPTSVSGIGPGPEAPSTVSSIESTSTASSTGGGSGSGPTTLPVGGGSGSGLTTSSPASAAPPESSPQFNGASAVAPRAAQMVGSAILLASMVFFV
ncbi:hypothetical protein N7457_004357 [Penicillium paradoxum]|uniref:uncharacterized protein n=1 Tax=Penicillium paradoxum TaxID=176176 RepID=UPI002549A3D6|nr:uncharacterized protein N7457_004357 [Penicillium paradoxum]KAJ5782583.1 hypothetical protein N7457_004357 [Penicillium paradoxum]